MQKMFVLLNCTTKYKIKTIVIYHLILWNINTSLIITENSLLKMKIVYSTIGQNVIITPRNKYGVPQKIKSLGPTYKSETPLLVYQKYKALSLEDILPY